MKILSSLGVVAALTLLVSPVSAVELSHIKGPMEAVGMNSNVKGSIQQIFHVNNPRLKVRLTGLTAGNTYHFTVDGVEYAEFVAPNNGKITLRFDLSPNASEHLLDFDPRGATLAVNDGTNDVLTAVCSGPNESPDIRIDERTTLLPADETVVGKVRVRYLEQKNQDRLVVFYSGMEQGNYEVYVDGILKGDLDLNKKRSGQITYRFHKNGTHGNGNSPVLDFDPRGKVVDVVKDDVVKFSGVLLAQIPGINVVVPVSSHTDLTSTGMDPDATATVDYKLEADGERELTVEVANLPDGDYTVTIGDSHEYILTVPDGKLRLSSSPAVGEQLLNFDPLGQSIVISQGVTEFFTGTINDVLVNSDVAAHLELPLLNQGVDDDATAAVMFEASSAGPAEFRVSVSNLGNGTYDLHVGGLLKGAISVSDNTGVIEFNATPTNGELLLDFDPRGEEVAVSQTGVVYLLRTLPE